VVSTNLLLCKKGKTIMNKYELRSSPGGYKVRTKNDRRCLAYFEANDMIRTTIKDAGGNLVLAYGGKQ